MIKNSNRHKRTALAALLVVGGLPWTAAASVTVTIQALDFPIEVTTLLDEADVNPGDGICQTASSQCSLRAAIQTANARGGADVIELGAGLYMLTLVNPDDEGPHDDNAATFGDLDITSELTILGAGADVVAIDGGKKWRVFDVHDRGHLTLKNLTISGGDALSEGQSGSAGGGIRIEGQGLHSASAILERVNVVDNKAALGGGIHVEAGRSLTVSLSNIKRNETLSQGGGINNNSGNVVIRDSHISDNKMFGGINPMGGGIYNVSTPAGPLFAQLDIEGSTISGNEAMYGGGLYHVVGVLKVRNSTISDNEAWTWGGGVYHLGGNFSESVFQHVTIAHNRARGEHNQQIDIRGAGIYNGNANLALLNSIVAYNGSLGHNCSNVARGQIDKQGALITDDSCINDGEFALSVMTRVQLGPLELNGGPTLTHMLLDMAWFGGSVPAYGTFRDQRGYARMLPLDVGAVNRSAEAPTAEVLPTPEYGGELPPRENAVPVAFGMPLAMQPGRVVSSVASAVDSDGDLLEYYIVDQPTKGSVGFDGMPFLKGAFTYRANVDASGGDSFSFKACDRFTCSAPARISITFMNWPMGQPHSIELRVASGGVASKFQVVAPNNLQAVTADDNFTRPFGAFFFDVTDIPATSEVTEVVIQLADNVEIADNAVVRKLDVHNVWHTLQSGLDPARSTATIDRTAKTIRLFLRDNDMFDLNPAVGVIRDPVALAVPVVKQETPSPSPQPSPEPVDDGKVDEGGNGGGGAILWCLALPFLLRRWSCRTT